MSYTCQSSLVLSLVCCQSLLLETQACRKQEALNTPRHTLEHICCLAFSTCKFWLIFENSFQWHFLPQGLHLLVSPRFLGLGMASHSPP